MFEISESDPVPEYLRPENMPSMGLTTDAETTAFDEALGLELDAIDSPVPQGLEIAAGEASQETIAQTVGNVAQAIGNVAQAVGNVAQAFDSVAEFGSDMIGLYNDAHATNHASLKSSDPFELGHDVGYFVNLVAANLNLDSLKSIEVVDSLILQSVQTVSAKYPRLSYLARSVYNQLNTSTEFHDPSIAERFEEIKKVFNGHNLSPESVFRDSAGHLSIIDEENAKQTYTGAVGTALTTLPGHVWCGPFSKNNERPSSVLDTFCFLHDISYDSARGGFFSLDGDLRFLSRVTQNLDRMNIRDRLYAKTIVIPYFSKIGVFLRLLEDEPVARRS